MKKQTYDLEERLLEERMNIEHRTSNIEYSMGKNEETEELISSHPKTPLLSGILRNGATSLFDVQGWMFDVLSVRCLSFHSMLNVRCSMLDVPLKRVTGESYVLDVIFQMLSFGRIR